MYSNVNFQHICGQIFIKRRNFVQTLPTLKDIYCMGLIWMTEVSYIPHIILIRSYMLTYTHICIRKGSFNGYEQEKGLKRA